jgi:hypothetical protein
MVWEPFLLAIGFGLAVSAGIYFAILWPQVEPLDEHELAVVHAAGGGAAAVTKDAATEADEEEDGEAAGDAGAEGKKA